jgi:hypothetical protein
LLGRIRKGEDENVGTTRYVMAGLDSAIHALLCLVNAARNCSACQWFQIQRHAFALLRNLPKQLQNFGLIKSR